MGWLCPIEAIGLKIIGHLGLACGSHVAREISDGLAEESNDEPHPGKQESISNSLTIF